MPQNNSLESLNLSQLLEYARNADSDIKTSLIESHEDFLEYIYDCFDRIITKIQKHRDQYYNQSEDQISTTIAILLSENRLKAEPKAINGNTDITVEIEGKPYQWICEAKLDNSPSYVHGGYLQLATRYSTYEDGDRAGGVVIYNQIYAPDIFLGRLKKYLTSKTTHNFTIIACKRRPNFSFFTESNFEGVGNLTYCTRFMSLNLFYSPEDKSAKDSKKHNKHQEDIKNRRLEDNDP